MKRFKGKPPYNADGKTNFRYTSGKPGVYVILREGEIVYIGHSKSDVYKTLYRHFQSWNDPTQVRVTFNKQLKRRKFICRVVLCTPMQAERLERALILKHKPKYNTFKYTLFDETAAEKRAVSKVVAEFIGTRVEEVPF
jgi:excinuclease UvrABC nuclease subunit